MSMMYSSADVLRMLSITYRQLDHWCRTGRMGTRLMGTTGSGNDRTFTSSDVNRIRHVAALVRAGFKLDAAFVLAGRIVDGEHEVTLAIDQLVVRVVTAGSDVIARA